jgi:hypothetical protein
MRVRDRMTQPDDAWLHIIPMDVAVERERLPPVVVRYLVDQGYAAGAPHRDRGYRQMSEGQIYRLQRGYVGALPEGQSCG